jgi:hypothetical protein
MVLMLVTAVHELSSSARRKRFIILQRPTILIIVIIFAIAHVSYTAVS